MTESGSTSDIYLVECGEYSGRYIAGAYRTADEADAAARASGGQVIEIDFGALGDEERRWLRPGERLYQVVMDANGDGAQVRPTWSQKSDGVLLRVRINRQSGQPERLTCTCWAQSEQGAIKILNERRTAWMNGPRAHTLTPKLAYGQSDYGWREAILS